MANFLQLLGVSIPYVNERITIIVVLLPLLNRQRVVSLGFLFFFFLFIFFSNTLLRGRGTEPNQTLPHVRT